MNTLFVEIYAGTLIFAAGNVAYFEFRRLIRYYRAKFNNKSDLSPAQTSRHTLHN
jgi:hypothetical protein